MTVLDGMKFIIAFACGASCIAGPVLAVLIVLTMKSKPAEWEERSGIFNIK